MTKFSESFVTRKLINDARNGGKESFKKLLQNKKLIMASLVWAEENGDLDFILELAKENIYVDLQYKILRVAKKYGHEEIVDSVLKRAGTDVNLVDEDGKSLLMLLASENHEEMVGKFLKVAQKEVLNLVDKSGCTALMHACLNGRAEVAKILLEDDRVDVGNMNSNYLTAQDIAQIFNERGKNFAMQEVAELIRERVFCKRKVSNNFIATNHEEKKTNPLNSLSLLEASEKGELNIVKSILQEGIENVNSREGRSGSTALMKAIKNCKIEVVEMLLHFSADVNLQDTSGTTALMKAIKINNKQARARSAIVNLILNVDGVDLGLKNNDNKTAYDIALDAKRENPKIQNVVELIEKCIGKQKKGVAPSILVATEVLSESPSSLEKSPSSVTSLSSLRSSSPPKGVEGKSSQGGSRN